MIGKLFVCQGLLRDLLGSAGRDGEFSQQGGTMLEDTKRRLEAIRTSSEASASSSRNTEAQEVGPLSIPQHTVWEERLDCFSASSK